MKNKRDGSIVAALFIIVLMLSFVTTITIITDMILEFAIDMNEHIRFFIAAGFANFILFYMLLRILLFIRKLRSD